METCPICERPLCQNAVRPAVLTGAEQAKCYRLGYERMLAELARVKEERDRATAECEKLAARAGELHRDLTNAQEERDQARSAAERHANRADEFRAKAMDTQKTLNCEIEAHDRTRAALSEAQAQRDQARLQRDDWRKSYDAAQAQNATQRESVATAMRMANSKPAAYCHTCGVAMVDEEVHCDDCGDEMREDEGWIAPPGEGAAPAQEQPRAAPSEIEFCSVCGEGVLPEPVLCERCARLTEEEREDKRAGLPKEGGEQP